MTIGTWARTVGCAGLAMSVVALVISCQQSTRPEEAVGEASQALSTPVTFSIQVPNGMQPEDVLFSATQQLKLNDRVQTVRGSGFLGSVFSGGNLETNIGVSVRVGDIRSTGAVALRNNAVVDGFVRTPAGISSQQGAFFSNGSLAAALKVRTFNWTVQFPQGTLSDVILQPNQPADRAPGDYANVIVNSGAKLTLHAGTYTFRSLDLEPSALLVLDKAAGPIRIYVRDSMIFRGGYFDATGRPGNVLVGFAGTGTVSIEAPYPGGALIAPFGNITLASVAGPHRGQFFGKVIEVHQDSIAIHQITPALNGVTVKSYTSSACNAPAPCPTGQHRTTYRDCKPVKAAGAACVTGDLCDAGLACISGTCQSAPTDGGICNTADINLNFPLPDKPCAYSFTSEEPLICGPDTVGAGLVFAFARRCQRGRQLGEGCSTATGSVTCSPGLNCVGGTCQVPCTSAQDCPCGTNNTPLYQCDVQAGICNYCVPTLHAACGSDTGHQCCDSKMACETTFTNGVTNEPWWGGNGCAIKVGQPCAASSDCQYDTDTPLSNGPPRSCVSGLCTAVPRKLNDPCGMQTDFDPIALPFPVPPQLTPKPRRFDPVPRNDYCAPGLTCDPMSITCKALAGTTCTVDADCRQGLKCLSGSCAVPPPPCVAGGACSVPGALGECAKGTFACENNLQVCKATLAATAETCDGKDNDCNGVPDDNIPEVGQTCTPTTVSGCQAGFVAPGVKKCTSSGIKCTAVECDPNDPFEKNCMCRGSAYATGANGLPCGQPTGQPCINGATYCTPNWGCQGNANTGFQCQHIAPCGTTPACYKPTDLQNNPNGCFSQ